MNGIRSFYVVTCHETRLPILDYFTEEDFQRFAAAGGFIMWLHQGLRMLIPAFRVRNMAAFMRQQENLHRAPGVFFFTQEAAVLPVSELAEAILGE